MNIALYFWFWFWKLKSRVFVDGLLVTVKIKGNVLMEEFVSLIGRILSNRLILNGLGYGGMVDEGEWAKGCRRDG